MEPLREAPFRGRLEEPRPNGRDPRGRNRRARRQRLANVASSAGAAACPKPGRRREPPGRKILRSPEAAMLDRRPIESVVDLIDPEVQRLCRMTVEEARRRVGDGSPGRVAEID